MYKPVDHCRCHLFIVEDSDPAAEFQIGRYYHAPPFVAVRYDLKKDLG